MPSEIGLVLGAIAIYSTNISLLVNYEVSAEKCGYSISFKFYFGTVDYR